MWLHVKELPFIRTSFDVLPFLSSSFLFCLAVVLVSAVGVALRNSTAAARTGRRGTRGKCEARDRNCGTSGTSLPANSWISLAASRRRTHLVFFVTATVGRLVQWRVRHSPRQNEPIRSMEILAEPARAQRMSLQLQLQQHFRHSTRKRGSMQ